MSGTETKIMGRARQARIVAGICAGIAATMRQRDPGLVMPPAHDPAAASRLAPAAGPAPTLATVLPW